MMPKRIPFQCSTLKSVSRSFQRTARDPQPKFYSSSLCRFAPTSVAKSQSKPTVPRASSYFSTSNAAASIADPQATERLQTQASDGPAATTYATYGVTNKLFEICSEQADYETVRVSDKEAEIPKTASGEDLGVGEGWWYDAVGLLPTFSSWSQVTFLHMYLLTVRIRNSPSNETVQEYSRCLVDHFTHEAERRMDEMHGIQPRGTRRKYVKDLFLQWRGILAAYDEGLVKGDAVLGAAVWRNVFKGASTGPDGKEFDWKQVAQIVAYMRRVLRQLATVDDASLVEAVSGTADDDANDGIFAANQLDEKLIQSNSKGLTEPFGASPSLKAGR